jgi:phosphatidylserine/phosphatidylglycerophosphate/cardiolipin synthase-like enzyme
MTNGSTTLVKVYDNGDHTCLAWRPPGGTPIADCRGYIVRRLKNGVENYLHGVVGFSDTDKFDVAKPWNFPLQRFLWWDYFVRPGDTVQYSVVPVVGTNKDSLAPVAALASPLTAPLTVTGQSTAHISAYFNKGIVAAQWVSKALDAQPAGSKIADLVKTPGNTVRRALAGLLLPQILSLLADAKQQNGKIFAALYELNDPDLIAALKSFGPDCSLILANGAKTPDENKAVRDDLKQNSTIHVFDRLVSSSHFAHNKFVVFCDAAGVPLRVLTGSTNWTSSGLCTQANNALIIADADIAKDFLAAWKRLQAAGSSYPPELVAGNDTSSTYALDGGTVTPWFVKTSAAQDLDYARRLINGAQDGILFLFFNPGRFQADPHKRTLLQDVLARTQAPGDPNYDAGLYVRGVVNQDIPQLTSSADPTVSVPPTDSPADPTAGAKQPVTLYAGGTEAPQRLGHEVLVPHNIKTQFHTWEKELLGASMVNVHSKVIVLDPFGAHPVVMTGSHNLGFKASNANDDNLVIIEGNAPLAASYAINIVAIFQTYRWNSYVETHRQDPTAWHGLADNATWQDDYLTGAGRSELEFWLGRSASTNGATAAAPQPVAGAIRSISSHS